MTDTRLLSFWEWAVAAYGTPGVADLCLDLQDRHDQCVPLLLWAAWLAAEGQEIDSLLAEDAVKLTRPWAEEVVAPLRQVRRRLKTPLDAGDEAVRLPLREKIKAAELQAEKTLMTRLETLANHPKSHSKQGVEKFFRANLLTVCRAWSSNPPEMTLRQLAQALTKP